MIADVSMQFSSLWPGWLLGLLALALLAALAHGVLLMVRKHVARRWIVLLATLRLAAFTIFALIVLQPALAWTRSTPPLPTITVLVDASASMAPHREKLFAVLQRGEFANALEQNFHPHWFRFDRTAAPMDKNDLTRLATDGTTTRIADSLAAAASLLRAEGTPAPRVLLVTDGLDRGGIDVVQTARRLGITVDVLAPQSKTATAATAVAITDVQGSRRVLLGSETHFRITLAGQAASQDRKLLLRMSEDGKPVRDAALVFKEGGHEQTVTLAHRPTMSGTRLLEFQLVDDTAAPVRFPVQVIDGKFEILLLEDTWRWDYKFLHRLFEDDPGFRFTALLARGGGSFTQFGSPDRRVNLIGFPQSRAELEGFDLFFVGDVNPSRWPPRLAAGLAHLVEEEGKSLVVIGGPNLAKFADVPELHALLPVEIVGASGRPLAGPVAVRLRADASASPFFFQIGADVVDTLPPLDQLYPPLRKRSGATVLVEAAKHRNPHGPLIVAAEHTVGRGRVLFIGTDTLWKWHTLAPAKDGPTPYSLFWQQAMRALTPERSRVGAVDLWLRPSRTRAAVGESVELIAELQTERPLKQSKLQADAIHPDGRRIPLVLAADPTQPNQYRANFAAPEPGTYTLSATVALDGQRAAENSVLVQVEEQRGESSDGSVDLNSLQRLVSQTGGRMIDPARNETWPTPSAAPAAGVSQTRVFALWDNFTLLLLLCALLGADWLFRLMKGLV